MQNNTTAIATAAPTPRHVTLLNVELRPDWSRHDCSVFETYPSPAAACANTLTVSSFTSVVTYSSFLKVKANRNKYDSNKPQYVPVLSI